MQLSFFFFFFEEFIFRLQLIEKRRSCCINRHIYVSYAPSVVHILLAKKGERTPPFRGQKFNK